MRTTCRHPAKGFTLLELLVVSVLSVGLVMMTAQMWRYFSAQAADLTGRTTAAQELRLALESLSNDMGSEVWAVPTAGGGLQVCRVAADGQDYEVIEYSLRSGRLVRTNSAVSGAVTIADGISDFTVAEISATVLQVRLSVTVHSITRQATLFWSLA
jgi:prepilin-type N-terminal cleavage/methylation domain-containing protein